MIGWQEVPAKDLIGQSQVALEDRGHLGVEVLPAAELLQHLHGQHEDLAEILFLRGGEDRRMERKDGMKGRCIKTQEFRQREAMTRRQTL